ncbi:MAG: hypothetical protein GX112_15670 [Clostridiaceae bacterium]|jgi:hypothetical protein|nr:hypothetical protein [Clostridiaceae bacterium]
MVQVADKEILRELAAQTAEVAALPVQDEKRSLWRALNGLKPVRPMVMIDQVCWHEMDIAGELELRCVSPEARSYEKHLRRQLYQWRHFQVDQVVEPFIRVPMAIHNSGFGIQVQEQIAVGDAANDVVGHAYTNQFARDEDLEKIQMPVIWHDETETSRRLEQAHAVFDGLLEVVPQGIDPYLSVWDPISTWMGVQDILYALIDRPDFMLALANRMVSGYMSQLDQLEAQGLLCRSQSLIHCTGAWTDELPSAGFDPKKPRTRDLWMFGLAQLFATVSPDMFETFEIETSLPLFARFGLVYYGCCDPLDRKMDAVRRIPNLRKVSMSPWVDEERGAAEIGSRYVYSRKPNPALLAAPVFHEQAVRDHLAQSVSACSRHGCPLELILKDISTVKYEPQRLWRWAEIAMEVVQG